MTALGTMLIAFAAQAASAQAVQVPPQPELTRQIEAADAALFQLFFEGKCDPTRFRTMLADDIEFYHDKDGFVFRSAEAMVADYATKCAARAKPGATRSRRELVASSLIVNPVPGHGAMEAGEHLFYERKGDEPERLVGRALFAHVWRLERGTWKVSRVLSYSHRPPEGK